ncbi:MAG: choice-of-anchor D domain-containing protein, partial [Candidatus Tectomicrobia bacterium]|nr:choice-of-anchor D domain-containing protein [Candidatus Tectomicrobia bacterium]
TNNNSLQVALVTTNAGAITGTATVDLVSDASNIGNCAPNCQLQLPSQDVTVRGNVFRLANPTLNTPAIALAARVGDASPSRALSLSNTSPDQFTEGLNATLGAAPAGFTAQGSLTNLAAGQTNTTALQIALQTGTAGAFSGQTNVTFVSTGQGTTGAPDVGVGNASVTLSGNVYTPAQANVTPTVHFGIVHKDEVVSDRALTVTNAAAVTALNDVLRGGFSGVTGPFTQNGGTLGAGLAAGATDSQSLTVGLLTTTVGAFSGQATLALTSHNDEMADLNLAQVQIALSAQVNNFANPTFVQTGGDGVLSRTGLLYTLDFGTITQQPGSATALLSLLNDVPGDPRFTDLLDGTFEGTVSRFLLSGFQPFVDIQGGSAFAGLSVALDTSVLGRFDERIVLHSFSHNDDFFGALPDVTLAFSGNIVTGGPADPVPEPSTLLLCLSGLLIGAGLRARRRRAGRAPTK